MPSMNPAFNGIKLLVYLFSLFLISSCAALTHGATQLIPISSTPSGAEIFIEGQSRGFTPLELELARNKSYEVVLQLGSQSQTVILDNLPEGGTIALDVVPAGLTGGLTLLACIQSAQDENPYGAVLCGTGALITALVGTPIYVDAATGAWYRLTPDEISVSFND